MPTKQSNARLPSGEVISQDFDVEVDGSLVPVIRTSGGAVPVGGATAAKQDAQTALLQTIVDDQPPLGRAAAAASSPAALCTEDKAVIDAINAKLATLTSTDSRTPVEPLGTPSVSRTLAAGAASASVTLTASCVRVSLVAVTADVAFRIGAGAQTAVATDHFLAVGERIDVRVPAGSSIGAIRAGAVDATLRISELT